MASLGGLLVSYGACQAACNAGAVACYSAAGLTFGAAAGGVPLPAAAGCCMAACAATFLVEGGSETAATGGWMGPSIMVGGLVLLGLAAWRMRQNYTNE